MRWRNKIPAVNTYEIWFHRNAVNAKKFNKSTKLLEKLQQTKWPIAPSLINISSPTPKNNGKHNKENIPNLKIIVQAKEHILLNQSKRPHANYKGAPKRTVLSFTGKEEIATHQTSAEYFLAVSGVDTASVVEERTSSPPQTPGKMELFIVVFLIYSVPSSILCKDKNI